MFDDIEEKTNGHVESTSYGSGTLASSGRVDIVADGACDIGWVFTSFYYGQYPSQMLSRCPVKASRAVSRAHVYCGICGEQFPEMRDEWSDFRFWSCFPIRSIMSIPTPRWSL